MSGHPTPFPSDNELKERAVVLLKQRDLFSSVSRRLLADLVDRMELKFVGSPGSGDILQIVELAVLVVLQGVVTVRKNGTSLGLQPGTYLPHDPEMREVGLLDLQLESIPPEGVRVFLLDAHTFNTRLPRMLVNALDPNVLDRMKHP